MSLGECWVVGFKRNALNSLMVGKKGKRLNMQKALPIRGGNWNNSANAGVFALNCNNDRSNANNNIGARPDSIPQTSQEESGLQGGVFLRRAKARAKSAEHLFSSRHRAVFDRLEVFF
jgi:hypothetical protein